MTKKSNPNLRPIVLIHKGKRLHLSETCDGQHRLAVLREIVAEIHAEANHQ